MHMHSEMGLHKWLVVKKLLANAEDLDRTAGSIPGSWISPRGGHGNPLQCSCPENPMDRGALWATLLGVAKSRTRLRWLSMHAHSEMITIVKLRYHLTITLCVCVYVYTCTHVVRAPEIRSISNSPVFNTRWLTMVILLYTRFMKLPDSITTALYHWLTSLHLPHLPSPPLVTKPLHSVTMYSTF